MTNALDDPGSIAALIDHTILKPEATRTDIERLCKEALTYKFASVCVNPVYLPFAAALLHGSEVKACVVVGFPLGANLTSTKVAESQAALADGARELDMVIHIGGLKSLADNVVSADIRAVCDAAHDADAICKVIIETCLLSEEEKARACRLAVAAGADFIKTSTGFASAGATVEDVALMRRVVGAEIGVKASGGIRTLQDLLRMVEAGATRIGSSNGVKIVEEARQRFGS
ncbi:MAG: deoxyribose-phosphate aldolase [Candidatus Acidiferrum sp.]|jgi:deoxyribose-phosphate aldolase